MTQVCEKMGCFFPVLKASTCNPHRLKEACRDPGPGALSALMMRQLEAIFQLDSVLTLKHL